MKKYFTLGTYSISVLHYSLFYCDERGIVFRRPLRVHKGIECEYYGYLEDLKILMDSLREKCKNPKFIYEFSSQHEQDFTKLITFIENMPEEFPEDNNALVDMFKTYWALLQRSQPLGDCFLALDEIFMEEKMN